jgi:sulfur-oxidizing protein SoxY
MTALSRRTLIVGTGAALVVASTGARATPETMLAAIREVAGTRALQEGKVRLEIEPLVDNGNTVPMRVWVDSPMTGPADGPDRVRALHVFNERNPQPHVLSVRFGPAAARARVSTRIKLGDSQKVVAVAEMGDGTCWTGSVDVIVTLAACLEGLI